MLTIKTVIQRIVTDYDKIVDNDNYINTTTTTTTNNNNDNDNIDNNIIMIVMMMITITVVMITMIMTTLIMKIKLLCREIIDKCCCYDYYVITEGIIKHDIWYEMIKRE